MEVILLAQNGIIDPITAGTILVIGTLFYVMILRPERRKRSTHEKMLQELKKNDRVVTIGGILGTITNVHKEEVTIKVDETSGTKLRVTRSSIGRIITSDDEDKKD